MKVVKSFKKNCTYRNTRGMCLWRSTSNLDPSRRGSASISLTDKCMYITDEN